MRLTGGTSSPDPSPSHHGRDSSDDDSQHAVAFSAGRGSRPRWGFSSLPRDTPGHPNRVLVEIIRDGSDLPKSRMPAFGAQLTDEDIEAIIEFIKTSWGPLERAYQDQATEQDQAEP